MEAEYNLPLVRVYWSHFWGEQEFTFLYLREEYLPAMEEALNSTIDPACLQEPPLAFDVIKGMWPTLLLSVNLLIMFSYQFAVFCVYVSKQQSKDDVISNSCSLL